MRIPFLARIVEFNSGNQIPLSLDLSNALDFTARK